MLIISKESTKYRTGLTIRLLIKGIAPLEYVLPRLSSIILVASADNSQAIIHAKYARHGLIIGLLYFSNRQENTIGPSTKSRRLQDARACLADVCYQV